MQLNFTARIVPRIDEADPQLTTIQFVANNLGGIKRNLLRLCNSRRHPGIRLII